LLIAVESIQPFVSKLSQVQGFTTRPIVGAFIAGSSLTAQNIQDALNRGMGIVNMNFNVIVPTRVQDATGLKAIPLRGETEAFRLTQQYQ
jgi:hypothetical protein